MNITPPKQQQQQTNKKNHTTFMLADHDSSKAFKLGNFSLETLYSKTCLQRTL